MTKRKSLFRAMSVFSVAMVVLGLTPSLAFALAKATAWFRENGPSGFNVDDMHGARAHWADQDWTIPCPSGTNTNRVDTEILSIANDSTNFVDLIYTKKKDSINGSCSGPVTGHTWLWSSDDSTYCSSLGLSTPCVSFGSVDVAVGTHTYSVLRKSVGCASGINHCWHFQVDGTTFHTCCGDVTAIAKTDVAKTDVICDEGDAAAGGNCQSTGLVDPIDNLAWMPTDDSGFNDWNGKDRACVDNTQLARGDWKTTTSVKAGYGGSFFGISGCQ